MANIVLRNSCMILSNLLFDSKHETVYDFTEDVL